MTLIPSQLREAVVRRAGNRCEYCHLAADSQVATFPIDHVLPIALAGPTQLENLALTCPRCNAKKWTYVEANDPVTGQSTPLYNPRIHDWLEHFRWSERDRTILESNSTIGRATLELG